MGERGTHSILDITKVVDTTAPPPVHSDDYGTLRPPHRDRVRYHLSTERPAPDQFRQALDRADEDLARVNPPTPEGSLLGECRMRWTAIYIPLYADDKPEPTHLGIIGASGD